MASIHSSFPICIFSWKFRANPVIKYFAHVNQIEREIMIAKYLQLRKRNFLSGVFFDLCFKFSLFFDSL